jgi:3-deoxy-D-manno-octulosonic-acid transferase
MMIILYQALGAVAILVLVALAPLVPALRRGLAERFVSAGRPRWAGGSDAGHLIHALVGEAGGAPLVTELLRRRPESRILLDVHGERAARRAAAGGREPRVRCLLLPLDWGWIPARVLRRERPALFILLETELWPVLLQALRRARVPVLVANGCPRAAWRYRPSAARPARAVRWRSCAPRDAAVRAIGLRRSGGCRHSATARDGSSVARIARSRSASVW